MFERSLVDVWNSEFLTKILKILESSEFYDCTLKLSYELRFEAHEFIQISPWLFSTAFVTPDIPANLSNDDYRCVMYAKAVENSDFIIHTKDGTIETVRYLVYLTIDRIHNEIDANPNMKSIIIEHRRESVQQMINYALKGSFDLIDASPDVLDDFILCIRAFRPRGFWTLIHHITDGLLVLTTINRLEYNVDSSGSKLEIYNTLKDSELPFEGNAIQKIQAVYYAADTRYFDAELFLHNTILHQTISPQSFSSNQQIHSLSQKEASLISSTNNRVKQTEIISKQILPQQLFKFSRSSVNFNRENATVSDQKCKIEKISKIFHATKHISLLSSSSSSSSRHDTESNEFDMIHGKNYHRNQIMDSEMKSPTVRHSTRFTEQRLKTTLVTSAEKMKNIDNSTTIKNHKSIQTLQHSMNYFADEDSDVSYV
ncbi:hypothetical protein DINM_000335 [Dirofilaria immitis]|nr:hypothetical protein [Dirofilaria immitis]